MAADKTTLEQMLEHLVNEDNEKAEELFHDYVVSKSREIYENLIQEEMDEEEDEDKEEKEVDESTDEDEDKEEKEVDEMFDEVAIEGDDEMDMMGGDKTDALADLDDEGDEGEEGEEKSEDELFQDLDDIVSELEAKFKELSGDEEGDEDEGDMDDMEMGDEMPKDESFEEELATVREYVEKVAGGHGAESKGSAEGADNKKSVVDNMKNDMGGTTANIAKGGEDNGKNTGGLADITAKEDNANNVNTAGSKNATKMTNVPGHGAEKKGSAESADNKQSIFRGQR